MKSIRYSVVQLLAALFVLSGCQLHGQVKSPTGYDLSSPEITELPKEVNQISGIAFYEGSVLAIDDDHGNLYKISLEQKPRIERWKVGDAKDYEDVVVLGNEVYILASKGEIIRFPLAFPVGNVSESKLGLKGKNEFESLHVMNDSTQLTVCKNCQSDKKDQASAFAYNTGTGVFAETPRFVLDVGQIESVLVKKVGKFRPSATNVHPITHQVFMISSINKLLVIADANLQVKEVYPLDPDVYKQPEGLCFSPGGDLLISNESANKGKANILRYRYRPK